MNKNKKISLKSQHDIVMEEFKKEGKVKIYSAKESLEIAADFTKGSSDFDRECTRKQFESERELKDFVLNA